MIFNKKIAALCLDILFFVYPINKLYAQDSVSEKHNLLLLPVIAKSIETSWSFGIVGALTFHLDRKDTVSRTSNLQALFLYSLKKQQLAALNGTTYFLKENYILNYQLSFSFFPDKFWGIGKIAPDSNEEKYIFKQAYVYLHTQRSVAKHFYVGLLYEYQNVLKTQYVQDGLFDKQNIVGRKGYHVSGLGVSTMYDSRNNAFAPDKGIFIQTSFNHFAPILGSDFSYTNYIADLRMFIKTHKKQVLAVQGYGFFNTGIVPLRSLASLGGANRMRGYYAGRYRDNNQLVFQTEYRVPVYWRFGVVAFGGVGNVGHPKEGMDMQTLKYSYGAGVRFALNKAEKLNLRLDYGVGKGKNNSGFYFQLGEAF